MANHYYLDVSMPSISLSMKPILPVFAFLRVLVKIILTYHWWNRFTFYVTRLGVLVFYFHSIPKRSRKKKTNTFWNLYSVLHNSVWDIYVKSYTSWFKAWTCTVNLQLVCFWIFRLTQIRNCKNPARKNKNTVKKLRIGCAWQIKN